MRSTHHGPIVNEALGADDAEPLALRWMALDAPTAHRGACSSVLDADVRRRSWSRCSRRTHVAGLEPDLGRPPRLDRLQADRPAAAAPRRLPRPAEAGLDAASSSGRGRSPTTSCRSCVDPESGFLVTANNRIVGDDYPHHITSEWLDGFRARRIEELLRATRRARPRRLRGDADRQPLDPRARGGAPARRGCSRATSARSQRDRAAARAGTGGCDPDSVAGTIYQAFLLRLRARGRARGDRRPRPRRALARPRRQRLHHPRHLALALALAPDGALGGGRRRS